MQTKCFETHSNAIDNHFSLVSSNFTHISKFHALGTDMVMNNEWTLLLGFGRCVRSMGLV